MTLSCLRGKDHQSKSSKKDKGKGKSKDKADNTATRNVAAAGSSSSSGGNATKKQASTTTTTHVVETRGEASIRALALAGSREEAERALPELLRDMKRAEKQAKRLRTVLKGSGAGAAK